MQTTKSRIFNIDSFVETIRNPYSEVDECGYIVPAKPAPHATKEEIVFALIKLISCIAVIVFGLCCMIVAAGPLWRLILLTVLMLGSFVIHCFADDRLNASQAGKCYED